MTIHLRPYQRRSVDAILNWVKRTTLPCLIEAATGAGKSVVLAEIAWEIHRISGGKHVLALAPSAELCQQNHARYEAYGNKASIFSASAGKKSLRHPVVFATPLTVKNCISKFGSQFAMVAVDECHGMTPTVKSIIDAMRQANPNLRVVGLTATPYRMGEGYIFNLWPDDKPVHEGERLDEPYFAKCVDRITAQELIAQGFLMPPLIGGVHAESYHTKHLALNSRGQFDAADVDQAYHGHGRKTARIIADVIEQARGRHGVMIFAATVKHALECMASLPPALSAMVTGETPRKERAAIVSQFKRREIRYLVNVAVFTTGFDAAHVDVIALLRATESVGLLQQIIGRGLRLSPETEKRDCLLLDYAENLERHCPDGDVFSPKIVTKKPKGEGGALDVTCPLCSNVNQFTARKNDQGFSCTPDGYFADLDGNPIPTDWGNMPSHYGRRCQSRVLVANQLVQCAQRWTFKTCPECDAENDIAARYCEKCRGEIVDPNEKLRIDYKAMKRDPTQRQTDITKSWECTPSISQSGRPMYRIEVVTPYRSFTYWVMKEPRGDREWRDLQLLMSLQGSRPATISYHKDAASGFYRVFGYNRVADAEPVAGAMKAMMRNVA